MTALVDTLRSGSDLEATTVLARLRLGETIEEIVQCLDATKFHGSFESDESYASPGSPLPVDHLVALPESRLPLKHPTVSSGALDIVSSSSEKSNAVKFLSVIFEREEFRLPAGLYEEDIVIRLHNVTPTAVAIAHQPSGAAQSHSFDVLQGSARNRHQSLATVTTGKSISSSRELDRRFQRTWATYPRRRDGLAAASSFKITNTMISPNVLLSTSARDLAIPSWAMMNANTKSGSSSMNSAFSDIQKKAAAMALDGISQEAIVGSHPNIAALFNEDEYKSSPLLSQWAAGMVHSVKLKGCPVHTSLSNNHSC